MYSLKSKKPPYTPKKPLLKTLKETIKNSEEKKLTDLKEEPELSKKSKLPLLNNNND